MTTSNINPSLQDAHDTLEYRICQANALTSLLSTTIMEGADLHPENVSNAFWGISELLNQAASALSVIRKAAARTDTLNT